MQEFLNSVKLECGAMDREGLESALQQSEYRYRQLLVAVTDYAYCVKVENGSPVRTMHGPGCAAITGYTPQEYNADPALWYKMIHPEDRDYVIEHFTRVLSGELVACLEHRIIHKDNSVRWIKHTPVQHFDVEGSLVSYDGLISDITEQKRLKEQLYQSQKMESIGRLAGGVAHDFNNYLSSIIGLAELTQLKLQPEDFCYQNLEKICDIALKAANITRQLLAFSSKQIMEPRVLDLNSSIREFIKMLEHLIGDDIELAISLEPDLGSVKADPSQVEQIIINLAINSRDAISNTGKIVIETNNADLDGYEAARVGVTPGRYILMTFKDTGIGISGEIMPHIFEPFFTTKEKGKGTGLGLATVYGIVEQHMGKILVYSEERKGTTFEIYLPRVDEKPEALRTYDNIEELPCCTGTILVVDDSEIVRDFSAQILRAYGYTVYEACNGWEALEFCGKQNKPFDLIITDVVMPNMGGRDFIDQLGNIWKDFKVLYMSGYADDVVSEQGILERNMSFINKPFVTAKLLKKVREVLGT